MKSALRETHCSWQKPVGSYGQFKFLGVAELDLDIQKESHFLKKQTA